MTLLIGSMVVVFSLSAGQALSFPLDSRQSVEFLLTSAVSTFALVLVAPRIVGWKTGMVLLVLFLGHLPFVEPEQRRMFSYLYLALAGGLLAWNWRTFRDMIGLGA